jgi:hypothetical protein
MSLMDVGRRRRRRGGPPGLDPPPATPCMIVRDLHWHRKLYEIDRLPWRTQIAFMGLRVVQRIAYNIGWWLGGRD